MSELEPRPKRRRRRRPASSSPKSQADSAESSHHEKAKKRPELMGPTKAETALLPAFVGVSLDEIYVPITQAECQDAVAEIRAAGIAGFDTEAKPTFRKGQKIAGPHVVQFGLTDKAFIFQLHRGECEKATADLIASNEVLKVGFGLKNDHKQIRSRLGIPLNHVLDLDQVFRKMGYQGQIGVRGAMGVLLKRCFKKSKSTTTSNWSLPDLTPRQLIYAANDAFAALKIMEGLQAEGHLEQRDDPQNAEVRGDRS
ncbi:MAG: ribonuclease D [Akkermansiaceae bacterium]|jgi:ribonuclease D